MQTFDLIQSIVSFRNDQNNNFNNNYINESNNTKISNLRSKRAFNVIDTTCKYSAGTPDHDDFEMFEFNMNELNKSNNKQVIINQIVNDRLNNVTKLINEMSNAIGKYNYLNNEIALTLQNRVRLIKEQLININYAIQWAKSGIINSIILNKLEIRLALEKLQDEKMPFASIEEAVEYAKVIVIYNSSIILYIIKIPLTNKKMYQKYFIIKEKW